MEIKLIEQLGLNDLDVVYEVYIIRKNGDCSKNEIKAIEKLCNVNYIKARVNW